MVENEKESWQIPILTRENHDIWLRRCMVELRGKGVFYVVEKELHEHAKVAHIGELTAALKNSTSPILAQQLDSRIGC